jgi:hypothetical protein
LAELWHFECTKDIKAVERLTQSSMPPEDTMRSDLVFGAMKYVPNRFLLTGLASKAVRSLHVPNTRIQDTTNGVFERFTRINPLAGIPDAGNVQSFPCTAQGETHSVVEDLEQSVA